MAERKGEQGRVVVNQDLIRVIARIRELTAKGYRLSNIEKLTGWSKQRIWNVQNGKSHETTSLPINELELRKPSSSGVKCRRCLEPARIFCKSGLCVQCELFELAKVGMVVIHEHSKE